MEVCSIFTWAIDNYTGMEWWKVVVLRERVFHPQESFLQRWNKIFLVLCGVALSLDPLFFYVPGIQKHRKCLGLDSKLETAAATMRSATDILYIIRIVFQFRTGFSARSFGTFESILVEDSWKIARRYLSSHFLIDILATFPLPQIAILLIIPKMGGSRISNTQNLLKFIVCFQLVPRGLRFYMLFKQTVKSSNDSSGIARNRVAVTLLLYLCIGHFLGGFWYLLAIEREMHCWREACGSHAGCNHSALYCSGHFGDEPNLNDYTFLYARCPPDLQGREPFDFGVYLDAHNSGILESSNFWQKFPYCFWWALQNLSTLGQSIKTSTNVLEICFAVCIFICGLVIFSFVIGIIQATMLSSTIRAEKMKMKRQDVEQWMDTYRFPENLRKRVKRHQQYNWQKTKGLDVDNLLNHLPKNLRRDITRHLCLDLLMRVPMFEKINEQLLDALCDRLKPALFTEESCILREGHPVDEMLFFMRGSLLSVTTNGGRSGFFNSTYLKAGDFCGEGLLVWALDPHSSNLPISRETVRTLTEVEAFAIMAEDLRFVASQFRQLHAGQLRLTFRFYSVQWRIWAACYIQSAWRCYRKKKLASVNQGGNRLHETNGNTLSLAETMYASQFNANVLCARRHTAIRLERPVGEVPLLPQKPAEPDFTVEKP